MKKTKSFNRWITEGYELFAKEGPDGIQIERLARMLTLNKSGFYYYFGTHATYFEHLMLHHAEQVNIAIEKISVMQNFAPEYIHWLSEYQTPLLVQRQLLRSRHIPIFLKTYQQTSKLAEKAVLPLWAQFIGLSHNHSLAARYLAVMRDVFFSRLSPATLSFEFIVDFSVEAKELCEDIRTSVNTSDVKKIPA